MTAPDLIVLPLNSLSHPITEAFISTFKSCIALVNSPLMGALLGSAITLYFTGHNQRKHLEREAKLKQKRELEEQRKLVLLELLEVWKAAFNESSSLLALLWKARVQNKIELNIATETPINIEIEDDTDYIPLKGDVADRFNQFDPIYESLVHLEFKFLFFHGNETLYKRLQNFHSALMDYHWCKIILPTKERIPHLEAISAERKGLVQIFRKELGFSADASL